MTTKRSTRKQLSGAALDAIVAALRETFAVERCTLRLNVEAT